jgi:hypothetical protein
MQGGMNGSSNGQQWENGVKNYNFQKINLEANK